MSARVHILEGDCLALLDTLDENSVDAVVTDPPYHLTSIVKRFGSPTAKNKSAGDGKHARLASGFMGKQWDGGDIAFRPETWAKVHRVMKPGAFLVAFSATRTYHRMACAIEDGGFIIRDQLDWLYGSGFPKSHDLAKAIDKTLGAEGQTIPSGAPAKRMIPGADQHKKGWEKNDGRVYTPGEYVPDTDEARQWQGWGTALKPAHEPIVLAQKPLSERTIALNVLRWGTGALNIAACKVPVESQSGDMITDTDARARWPANVLHDGSEEVECEFAAFGQSVSPARVISFPAYDGLGGKGGAFKRGARTFMAPADQGSPSRFFYSAKADEGDRLGSNHPTVKPVDLMAWLVRLTTPPRTPMGVGVVLDPFAGTGTTAQAALRCARRAIVIEREADYIVDIKRRIAHVEGADTPLFSGAPANDNAAAESDRGGRRIYGRFADEGGRERPPRPLKGP